MSHRTNTHVLVASLFLLLAISLESLMYIYWNFVLDPRLRIEAESNAKILAESQAKIVSTALSSLSDSITQDDIDQLTDQVLVFIDPELKRPYFLGIALELDYEALESVNNSLDLSEGDMQCAKCFPVTTALYSRDSDELLGVANFMVSDAFYEKLKEDVKEILFLESLLGLAVLFVVWIAVNFLIRKLNFEILNRKRVEKQLRHAKENAEKASQTKSEFLANMSHEIRTPLNAIIGMAYILLKTPLNKRQHDLLNKLDSSSHLLLNLINDLLDFSKIEAGKLELESTCFKLDEVLDNLAKLVMTKAGEKDLDIMYYTSRDIPHQLIGDPLRLGQVLLNLVNNAIKFTEKGEILLSVEVVKDKNCSNRSHDGICLQFSVHDTGIGIREEDISKLFHSFTQADNSTTRKFGGTGLGLSICKQLIHLMGGDIHAESIYGKGSTFIFSAYFSVETEQQSLPHLLPNNLQNSHALVIDDSKISQNIFEQMLSCFGFKISIASNAQEGFRQLEKHAIENPVQLILMDWQMPGMDGVEASHIIKTQLNLPHIPKIVLVTAYANQQLHKKNQSELDDYLIKPISQSVLYDSIINILSDKQTIKVLPDEHSENYRNFSLKDKHVLLTEDNATNQEVACALLDELELQISIANNGKEAVAAIKQKQFDLVFMDLQMPEMDGFEATQLIRQDERYKNIPIVAMTAHAMRGDREKCLNAQMDDYITKPIDVDKFFAVIEKWLVSEQSSLEKPKTESLANWKMASLVQQYPDLPSIDLPKALARVRGKQELMLRLLSNFKIQKGDMATKIKDALAEQDIISAKALVHSLKGEAGTLEATILFKDSQQLEQYIVQSDNGKISEYMTRVENALSEVLADIGKLENSLNLNNDRITVTSPESNPIVETTFDRTAVSAQLQELSGLIKDNNLRAKKLAKEINTVMQSSEHFGDWEKVITALSNLDFEQADSDLRELVANLEISI